MALNREKDTSLQNVRQNKMTALFDLTGVG